MKKLLWITIVGTLLTILAASGSPQPLASPLAPAQAECDCSKLKVLQIELRNAIRLQQAFRNKIPDLRGMNQPTSGSALKTFAANDARRGLETIPDYHGPKEVDYDNNGNSLSDPIHPGTTFTPAELCQMSPSATETLNSAVNASGCAGIGNALRAHEAVHQNSCTRMGFVPYFNMHGADRAQEEVEAYGAQIAVLRGEIAKVLEHADVRIVIDVKTRMEMPPNPLYTAINISNKAEVPMSRVAVSGEMIKLDGEGQQEMNGSIEGHCRFTAGLPSTLTARGGIDTDGLEATLHYAVEGTQPSVGMECTLGAGTGHGMSIPVHVGGGNIPDFKLPLEDGAQKEFDQGAGPAAQMMSSGGVKITGKGTIRLVLCHPK